MRTLTTLLLLFPAVVLAQTTTVIVTPDSPQGWQAVNLRSGGTSDITSTAPRSGTGSLEQYLPVPVAGQQSPKADHQLLTDLGPLSQLTALGFDWRRSSDSTAPGHLTPVLRIYVYDPIFPAGPSSFLLIWEGVYNGYPSNGPPVPVDQWITQNTLNGFFWRVPQFINGVWKGIGSCTNSTTPTDPYACYVFDKTLSQWGLSANTRVVGIEVGLGSGWNGSFRGFVDNVTIGFNGATTVWNFEKPPIYSCQGFFAPFDEPLNLKQKTNRVIPLKIKLFTSGGLLVTDQYLAANGSAVPVVNVVLNGAASGGVPTQQDLMAPGQANEGNQMRFDLASGSWIYNLATKPYTAAGVYQVSVKAGDGTYSIAPTCTQTFTLLP